MSEDKKFVEISELKDLKFTPEKEDLNGLIPGLKSTGPFTMELNWRSDQLTEPLFTSTETERFRYSIQGMIQSFKSIAGVMHEVGVKTGEFVRMLRIIYPMDRRQARRVSRKTGRRFRVHKGQVIWK